MTSVIPSTEILTNYLMGNAASPDKKFNAIQTPKGNSMLFSMSTDNLLFLTEEVPESNTGWVKNDISASLSDFFPGQAIEVKDFAVSQSESKVEGVSPWCLLVVASGTINNVKQDYLFMAKAFQRDANNQITISWTPLYYDGTPAVSPMTISGITLKDTASGTLIIIDISNAGNIMRFYVDANLQVPNESKSRANQKWLFYNLPTDIHAATTTTPVITVPGRSSGAWVNALYTMGQGSSGLNRIVYQELYDAWEPTHPAGIAELLMPQGVNAQNIATAATVLQPPTSDGYITDLYVTGNNGGLYIFPADQQSHYSSAQEIFTHELFKGVVQLFAYRTENKVVVWGRNSGGQVFYTQRPTDEYGFSPEYDWTYPMAIDEGALQISPYVNLENGGNTYFANLGQGQFKKVFQDPMSTLWLAQYINLPVDSDATPIQFDSYTTRVTFKDDSQNFIPNAKALLRSAYRLPVLINNRYYVLDTEPIYATADANGSLTIIQQVHDDLTGCCIGVQPMKCTNEALQVYEKDGPECQINPMDKSNAQLLALSNPEALASATIKNDDGTPYTYTDENGKPYTDAANNPYATQDGESALVPTGTDPADLEGAANGMTDLSTANNEVNTLLLPPTNAKKMSKKATMAMIAHKVYIERKDGKISYKLYRNKKKKGSPSKKEESDNSILVSAGDLLRKVRNTREKFRAFLQKTVENVWEFVCEIGGEVLKFIVDCVEKVAGAIQTIMQAIGAVVKGLLQLVKFLFSWDDIKITAAVHSKIIKVLMNDFIYGLNGNVAKAQLIETLGKASALIHDLTKTTLPTCPTFNDTSADASKQAASITSSTSTSSTSTTNSTTSQSSVSDTYLQDQLTGNVQGAELIGASEPVSEDAELTNAFTILKNAVEDQIEIISDTFQLFYDSILKDFAFLNKPILEVLKETFVIIADALLLTAENILSAFIDLAVLMLKGVWSILNQPIRIPILSPTLKVFFNYELPSALDVISLVAAMPANALYMVLYGKGPYSTKGVEDQIALDILDLITEFDENIMTSEQLRKAADTELKTLKGLMNPVAKKKSSLELTTAETFFMVSKSATACCDAIAGVFTTILSVPGTDHLKVVRSLYIANTIGQLMLDWGVSRFECSPAPALPDPVATYTNVFTKLKTLNKIIFLKNKISRIRIEGAKESDEDVAEFDRLGLVIDSLLSILLTATPIATLRNLFGKDADNEPVVTSIGLCDAGTQFCGTVTSVLASMIDFIPAIPGTGTYAAECGLKLGLGVFSGGTSAISGVFRGSEAVLIVVDNNH